MPSERASEIAAQDLFAGVGLEPAIAHYEAAGAVIVRGLIGQDWLARLRAIYDEMAEEATAAFGRGKPIPGMRQLLQRHYLWQEDARFRDFLFNSDVARAAAILMRSRTAQLYEDILITEPAGSAPKSGWHQDEPTWPVQGRQLSSVWFSLEPVGEETGAMRYVGGSHRGPLYHPSYVSAEAAGDDVRFWTGGAFPDVDGRLDETTVVLTDAEPGDAIVFHPRAIHTAYGSDPVHARRSFTIRFLGDDVRWLPKRRIFHPWMHDLGLEAGDRVTADRLPVVWSG